MHQREADAPTRAQAGVASSDQRALRAKGRALHMLGGDDHGSRKAFLKLAGGAGAVGAVGLLLAACGDDEEEQATQPAETQASDQVLDVLNYALTLEFLEAKFYRDVIEAGVIEQEMLASIAETFGEHEQQHVDALSHCTYASPGSW